MKKFLFFIFALALFGMTACETQPDYFDPDSNGGNSSSAFSMQIKTPWTPVNTYAPVIPIAGENDIFTLHMVFFERNYTGTGAYKGFYSVDIPEGQPLNLNVPVTIDFSEAGLSDREAYNIYLVANLDYYLPGSDISDWIAQLPGLREDQVIERTRAYVTGEPDESIYVAGDTPLPMSAVTAKEVNESRVDVILSRTVARFDITSHVKYEYDLVTASIWNGFPHSSIWEGDVDYANTRRIERYYGVRNKVDASSPEGVYEDIFGGLYSFENVVSDPAEKDKKTTCMIVGLSNRDVSAPDYGKVLYYRINIVSIDNGQNLLRNNSYQITIRNVNEIGYNTEREAYEGESNRLEIVINYWDVDNDGMIQYDGDNVLAVPMKRINIPGQGDEREYSIFTIGNGKLSISRNTVPAGIDVELKGNRLYVNSTPLTSQETERRGEIDLTFGSLKATVIIRQGANEDGYFLNVTPAELAAFPAGAPSQSVPVTVSASGPWKATIHNPGFSFRPGSNVVEISSDQGNTFTVSTTSANLDNISRFAFVKLYLVDEPQTIRTIVLQQLPKSSLTLSPEQYFIMFNPDGSLTQTSNNVFTVYPGDDGGSDPTINNWDVRLTDNTYFELVNVVHDTKDPSLNTFTVRAKGPNPGAGGFNTTVTVSLTSDPSISKSMHVSQGAYVLTVNPTTFDPIPASGGKTPAITVSSAPGLTWSATVTTNLSGHRATIHTSGRPASVTQLNNISLSERLFVEFPAIRQTGTAPVATVTVWLDGTNINHTFQVTQKNLMPRTLYFQSAGTGQGTLMSGYSGYNYFNVFGEYLKNWRYFGKEQESIVKTNGAIGFSYGKTPSASTTVYHANQAAVCSSSEKKKIYDWVKNDHRNFLIVLLDNNKSDQQAQLRLFSSQFTVAEGHISTTMKKTLSQTPQGYRNNKVWQYITEMGPFCNGTPVNLNNTAYYTGDACNGVLTSWPSTTIPIIMHPNNSSRAVLAIDPVLKLVIIGDSEMFCNRNTAAKKTIFTEGNDNWKVLNNLIAFIVNSGQYGDDFLQEFR